MKKAIIALITFLFSISNVYGEKAQPLDQVKIPIEKAIAVLKNPEYMGEEKKEMQRERIWEIVQEAFDFKLISIRAVARSWRNFDKKQKEEFVVQFTELLRNTYIDKLQGEFHDEEVLFLGQDMISEDKAVVKSKILRGNVEIPMDYSMHFHDNKWWIYDVNIEGVSLVKNYRNQFKSILAKESPDQLILRLKEKNEKHERDRTLTQEK